MPQRLDTSWLDVGVGENETFVIRDHGQLGHILSELPDPGNQYPKLLVFLGDRMKDIALQKLFPDNNIRRSRPTASIGLRIDNSSVGLKEPRLFVDGGVGQWNPIPCQVRAGARDYPIAWRATSVEATIQMIYTRLVFLFADVICIFADDFLSIQSVARFLTDCASLRSASSLPVCPSIIVISSDSRVNEFYQEFHKGDQKQVIESFPVVKLIHVDRSMESAFRDRLRSSIRTQMEHVQQARYDHGAYFSGLHLHGLFDLAVKHLSSNKTSPFNFVKATREGNPVPRGLSDNISHYFKVGIRGGCCLNTLVSSTASALLMDHYVGTVCKSQDLAGPILSFPHRWGPNSRLVLEPRAVFRTLYLPSIIRGIKHGPKFSTPNRDIINQVESEFVNQFYFLVSAGKSTADHRQDQLLAMSHELGRVQSDRICLYCLVRSAQHSQACHHALCDQCAQTFGQAAADAEHQFTISMCLLCLSRAILVIDVLPPTMNPTILAIDGGGVRGGIPLEYLLLIQEYLGPQCRILDLIDLSVGSSSSGSSFNSPFLPRGSEVDHIILSFIVNE